MGRRDDGAGVIGGGDTLPLRDRGVIGDTASAALVAADGTVDWWCPGRFDRPAAFFRLLDPEGGALRVGPAGVPRAGVQRYEGATNVLHTRLPAPEGELEITDFFPWNGQRPSGRIVRLITALRGRVDVAVEVVPGTGFGPARDVFSWSSGIAFEGVAVHTGCPMEGRQGRLTLSAGDRAVVVVEAVDPQRRSQPLSVDGALDLADRTATAWRSHVRPLAYDGPYRPSVERSLLALGLSTFGPAGPVVAAPTASLPQRVGGERNWDGRGAWLRDTAMAVEVARATGLVEAAAASQEWLEGILRRATGEGGARAFPLRPLYDVDGLPLDPGDERELALAGWRGSQPVRVGHGGAGQLQLDFYAELVDALLPHAGRPSSSGRDAGLPDDLWESLVGMADWLAEAWREPDHGIWQIRSEPRQLTSSKLACWYTLERMAEAARSRDLLDLSAVSWRAASREVVGWLETHGQAADGGLRGDLSPADPPDAHLVQVAWRNPWAGDDRIVSRTVDRVIARLGSGPFVARYDEQFVDGLPAGEGAVLACSFWVVEALAVLGRWEEAHERMEGLCGFSRPLGLLPEQADPADGGFLGNLPHASSHLALIRAALALASGPR